MVQVSVAIFTGVLSLRICDVQIKNFLKTSEFYQNYKIMYVKCPNSRLTVQ